MRIIIYLGYVSFVQYYFFNIYFQCAIYKNKYVIVWMNYFASLDWVLVPDSFGGSTNTLFTQQNCAEKKA